MTRSYSRFERYLRFVIQPTSQTRTHVTITSFLSFKLSPQVVADKQFKEQAFLANCPRQLSPIGDNLTKGRQFEQKVLIQKVWKPVRALRFSSKISDESLEVFCFSYFARGELI